MLGGSTERVCFQTRVDKGKLGKFREHQEREGRTARSLIEDFFDQLAEADDKRKEREGRRQRWQMQ
jgi:hypothetical protein